MSSMRVDATSSRGSSARARAGSAGVEGARRRIASIMLTLLVHGSCGTTAILVLSGCAAKAPPRTGPAAVAASRARVAAVVNGEVITVDALDARLRADRDLSAEIAGLDDVTIETARREILSEMIVDTLIAQEAHRQGISSDALRESIVRDVAVSEREIDESYRLLQRARSVDDPQTQRRVQRLLSGTKTECRARLRAFVQREKEIQALQTFALGLRQQATIQVLLEPPRTRTN